MEAWQRVWRDGFAPCMSDVELLALRDACVSDDPRLIPGVTTSPPPLDAVRDWPCDGGCAIGFAAMSERRFVGEVEERFAQLCFDADQRLGEAAACRHFLNWFDGTPRDVVLPMLAGECELALAGREVRA